MAWRSRAWYVVAITWREFPMASTWISRKLKHKKLLMSKNVIYIMNTASHTKQKSGIISYIAVVAVLCAVSNDGWYDGSVIKVHCPERPLSVKLIHTCHLPSPREPPMFDVFVRLIFCWRLLLLKHIPSLNVLSSNNAGIYCRVIMYGVCEGRMWGWIAASVYAYRARGDGRPYYSVHGAENYICT